jgi:glycosyltransferase involved in cell wall biosynthesis
MHLLSTPSAQRPDSTSRLPDVMVCFSHLRWDFVFQRPQQLLTRFSKLMKIFYVEEPVYCAIQVPYYAYASQGSQLTVITPQLPLNLKAAASLKIQKELFEDFMSGSVFHDFGFWYYTPMALEFTRGYSPQLIVFDCMDELSAFKFAPESIKILEKELLTKADIVFTGGHSLYEAKKKQHYNIHAFPSSIDKAHFVKARELKKANVDVREENHFKLGFYGVIDERFDIKLIREIAEKRPYWEIILIGPVVKIDPSILPENANIRYLGPKTYAELPDLISDWDLALIPFLLNESTRFISPTKTPEYLAAGLPVVSTPIKDVINPYGTYGLVSIAQNAEEFVACVEKELERADRQAWLQKVDFFLAHNSWDDTCLKMSDFLRKAVRPREAVYNSLANSNV